MGLMPINGEFRRMSSKEALEFINDINKKSVKRKGYYTGTCVHCGKSGDVRRMETIDDKLYCHNCSDIVCEEMGITVERVR